MFTIERHGLTDVREEAGLPPNLSSKPEPDSSVS